MFGYVRAYRPEMRIKEYDLYKALYCGLCRSMGRCTGCLSRFSLSYDFAFLAALRMALTGEENTVRARRCFVHPFKKRPMIENSPETAYCARACACLTEAKLKDDVNDLRGFRRFLAAAAKLPAAKAAKKADLPELKAEIEERLKVLYEIERQGTASIDKPASVFGELTALVFSYGLADKKSALIAKEIGFYTGKFIYVADAADDFLKDLKRNEYNPLRALSGKDEIDEESGNSLRAALSLELERIECAVNLIDFTGKRVLESIIRNIINYGMGAAMEKALAKRVTPPPKGSMNEKPL